MSNNYLIIGDDEYIRKRETDKIKKKFLPRSDTDLDYAVLTPDDIEEIINSLETIPFLSEKRVLIVKEAHELFDRFGDRILSYLENPMDTSILIMVSGSSLNKSKLYKKLVPLVNIIKADKPTPVTIRQWIRDFFKKENIEISREAVELIVELKGTDTSAVKVELDKLVSFSGGKKIEAAHIEELVGRSVTETVFKLVDAINTRNAKWCFRILDDLYAQKKQPQEIVGYLGWYIRVMQKIRLLSGRGMALAGIASELKYSQGYARKLFDESKKYSADRIDRWTSLLVEADRNIKTSGTKRSTLGMEMLLVSLLDG